jgi:hypothetical protein
VLGAVARGLLALGRSGLADAFGTAVVANAAAVIALGQ